MEKLLDAGSTSVSLLRRVSNLDPEAWHRFVVLYAPLVYRWCRKSGLQNSDVEDVSQEVFRSVATGIDRFTRDEPAGRFRSWLFGVTRNKLSDHFRNRGKSPGAIGGASDFLNQIYNVARTEADDDIDLDTAIVHRVLVLIRPEFEPHCWDAFWRTTVGDERAADIAEELGMTKAAVRQAKYRVLKRLRLELDQQMEL